MGMNGHNTTPASAPRERRTSSDMMKGYSCDWMKGPPEFPHLANIKYNMPLMVILSGGNLADAASWIEKPEKPQKEKIRIQLPEESGEPAPEPTGSLLSHLSAWAGSHHIDLNQALLVGACAAAHAAGPLLDFTERRKTYYSAPSVPTLIASRSNIRFRTAVSNVLKPLRRIQQDLIGKYGEPPVRNWRVEEANQSISEQIRKSYDRYHGTKSEHLNPDLQSGVVPFLLEGKFPSKPHRTLEKYHLHTALAHIDIAKLPQTTRARNKRLETIASMVGGYRNGKAWARGFIRVCDEDFESFLNPNSQFVLSSLPVGESEESCTSATLQDSEGASDFDRIHQSALRDILRLRFDGKDPGVDYKNEKARELFESLRKIYREEMPSVAHAMAMSAVLPDLFSWYLLQLSASSKAHLDEMTLASLAIDAARDIRRKAAKLHDSQAALLIARKQHSVAMKLVRRLDKLGGSCSMRDLVRGLDKQRTDLIQPIFEVLIHHRAMAYATGGKLIFGSERFDQIALEAFAPPLEDVPYSLTKRLRIVEQRNVTTSEKASTLGI